MFYLHTFVFSLTNKTPPPKKPKGSSDWSAHTGLRRLRPPRFNMSPAGVFGTTAGARLEVLFAGTVYKSVLCEFLH